MGVSGVAGARTRSTHIMEVERTLGFKASDYDGDATLALLELELR